MAFSEEWSHHALSNRNICFLLGFSFSTCVIIDAVCVCLFMLIQKVTPYNSHIILHNQWKVVLVLIKDDLNMEMVIKRCQSMHYWMSVYFSVGIIIHIVQLLLFINVNKNIMPHSLCAMVYNHKQSEFILRQNAATGK